MSSAIASSSRQSVQRRAFSSSASASSSTSAPAASSSSPRLVRPTTATRHRNGTHAGRALLSDSRHLHSSSRALSPSEAETPLNLSSPSPSSSTTSPSGSLPPLARRHPTLYASVRPQQTSALAALAARLHLTSSSHSKAEQERVIQLVAQACTHPSFVYVVRRAKDAQRKLQGARAAADPSLLFLDEIREETIQDNAHLAALGNSLLGLLGSEALHLKYPHLPTRVLKAALSAYVGSNTTADVGSELGLAGQGILRWDRGEMETDAEKEELRFKAKLSPLSTASISARKRKGAELPSTAINSRDARSLAVRALLGVIYQEKGVEAVKHILHTRFLSRRVDLASMLKFQDPKRVLSSTCAKYGRERPQSRLIAETGRLSNTPLYVVGVYSGKLKLGEGFGSSIKMAEFRSAEDALRRLYLAQAPFDASNLPSSTLRSSSSEDSRSNYVAPPLGTSEVVHGSRDQIKA